MIKAILFDLDGVLIDACEWHYEALNRALSEIASTQITRDEHVSTFNGLPTRTKLKILIEQGRVQEDQVDDIYRLKQQYTIDVISECIQRDYKKRAMLHMLRLDGIKIGCVTNCIRQTAELMLEKSFLFGELDVLISNQDVSMPKPHPEGYWKAMSALGVLAGETIIVEDSPNGKDAARAAGANLLEVENAQEVTWRKIARRIEDLEEQWATE